MNKNMILECETCKQDIDCRVGMSNRDVQPFRFCCQACGSPIDFTLYPDNGMDIKGGSWKPARGLFNGTNPFVDLHLDFPVRYGKYVMGNTPYFAAFDFLKANDVEKSEVMAFHTNRLDALNSLYPKSDVIRNLIRLYSEDKNSIFKEKAEVFLKEKFKSLEPQDINACLYKLISVSFSPIVPRESLKELVEGYSQLTFELASNNKAAFHEFMSFLLDTKFMKQLQLDCLKLYPEILDAELPLRPALFLDFVGDYGKERIAARVSTEKFNTYKDLFKDISEVLSRQLVIVAGINNLLKRGDFNAFAEPTRKGAKKPPSLNAYADMPFGVKVEHLDDCWYNLEDGVVDNQLRNSVAHYKTEYDEVTQIITYYPHREGVHREKAETIYFLDFMRKILISFREVHYLHHLIKCLFYYSYLIFRKK